MTVTVGRLRSGNTSTRSFLAVSVPNTTSTPATTSTRIRFLRDWVTRNVNMRTRLPDLIEKFGALHHDACAGGQAIKNDDPFRIERFDAHDAWFEPLGASVLKDDGLTVGAAQDACAG